MKITQSSQNLYASKCSLGQRPSIITPQKRRPSNSTSQLKSVFCFVNNDRQKPEEQPTTPREDASESPRKALPRSPLPFLSDQEAQRIKDAHKPVLLILASAHILGWTVQLAASDSVPLWLPLVTGSILGSIFSYLNTIHMKHIWKSPDKPLNVVITGGSKGIGRALAREFLYAGDNVIITSRTQADVDNAVDVLKKQVSLITGNNTNGINVFGIVCDISDADSVEHLVQQAGRIDIFINNAGYSGGGYQNLSESQPETIKQVVETNLVGTLLATRAAIKLMQQQPQGGHIFTLDGAGADGMATPSYAAYGSTKAAIAHIFKSLQAETVNTGVCIHNLSPGMVLTPLLLEKSTPETKQIFNILCEYPETVAAYLVPRVRTVVARGTKGSYIRYLTVPRALSKFATSLVWKKNQYFDKQGNALYPSEDERLGEGGIVNKQTERRLRRAAARSWDLGLAYSISTAIAFLILAVDTAAKAGQ